MSYQINSSHPASTSLEFSAVPQKILCPAIQLRLLELKPALNIIRSPVPKLDTSANDNNVCTYTRTTQNTSTKIRNYRSMRLKETEEKKLEI